MSYKKFACGSFLEDSLAKLGGITRVVGRESRYLGEATWRRGIRSTSWV
jgi:hypothetical protein